MVLDSTPLSDADQGIKPRVGGEENLYRRAVLEAERGCAKKDEKIPGRRIHSQFLDDVGEYLALYAGRSILQTPRRTLNRLQREGEQSTSETREYLGIEILNLFDFVKSRPKRKARVSARRNVCAVDYVCVHDRAHSGSCQNFASFDVQSVRMGYQISWR